MQVVRMCNRVALAGARTVGPGGWVGVWLDKNTDWKELKELIADSWRLVAPNRVAATLPRA